MSGTDQVIKLLGVHDCSLISSRMTVRKGRRLQIFLLSYCGPVPAACPVCGSPLRNHGSRTMGIVSTPHLGVPTELEIVFPRLRCPTCCNIWRPRIGGVDEVHRMTDAAYADIAQQSLCLTFRKVAEKYPLSHATVKNVFEDYMRENAAGLRFKVPAFLGIDEQSLKRVGMVTVITDLENRTVFDMVPGRTLADLENYFSKLEGLEQVQWVLSDMYRPFWKNITKYTPNATWVIDRFHVMKGAIEALNCVRRSLQGVLDQKGILEFNKEPACAVRKQTCAIDLYKTSAPTDDAVYATFLTAYNLKEDFFSIYDDHTNSRKDAEEAFDVWRESVPEDKVFEPFRVLAGIVENNRELIFNYWDCPAQISNVYAECARRLIEEKDMQGRGCSFETLRARTLYRRQNLARIIASNGRSIGPRIDAPGPLFLTEPDSDDEIVDNFTDGSRAGGRTQTEDKRR